MSVAREVDDGGVDGDHPVERIVFELIDQFRSVGRPLRFYEVETKLLNGLEKLRLPAEKLEKEMGLLRVRLEGLGSEKGAIEIELRKMRDCVELSGVFSRLGWSGGVDSTERSAEEIYKAMLSKLMSGNGEDLSEVVGHLRKKVEELERDSWDVGVLRRNMERLEGENAELKRKGVWGSREVSELKKMVKELEVENVELRKKGVEGSRDVGEMKRKMEALEKEKTMLGRKVEGSSCDAMELRMVKKELALANAKLNVKEELTMANEKLKVKLEGNSRDFMELSRKVEVLEAEKKDLKTDLAWNVAKLRRKTEDTELQYAIFKMELDESEKICEDLKSEKGILERKNEVMQRDLEALEKEKTMLGRKVEGSSRDAKELRMVKEELALANAKLNVKEELTMANVKLKVKLEGNLRDFMELSRKVEVLEAENKDLKTDLEWNVAKLRKRTEDTELQYAIFKRELDESEKICEDLKSEKGILERKNEVMQRDLDKLAQENKKLEKKISWWKKNYEELDKRVIVLEKDVIELKSCDEGIVGHGDGRAGHCTDEKLDSRSKNGKTCYAENGDGNGKHGEVIGTVLSVENRRNDGVHSAALPTGNTTPISGELVELMDSDDDTPFAGCLRKNKHFQNSLDKGLPLSSTRELKRKSGAFIDLTENEDNKKNGDDFCRSSSWMANNKRSDLGLGQKLDIPRSSGSSSVPPHYCSHVFPYSPGFGKDGF